MKKLTIIKTPIDNSLNQAVYCYLSGLPPFTMFVAMFKENSFTISKDMDFETLKDRVNVDKLPKDLLFERVTWNNKIAGNVMEEPYMLNIAATVPISLRVEIQNALAICGRKAIKKQGVDTQLSKHREDSNDYVVSVDGKKKKFSGILKDVVQDKKVVFIGACFILEFTEEAKELWRKLYRLDSSKVKKRGDIKDLFDIMGGLKEVNPNIDVEQLKEDFIQLFAERFDLKIEERDLTEDELLDIKELKGVINDKDWVRYKKIPPGLRPKVKELLK